MTHSIKKSNFNAVTAVTDADFFDFVRNGTNIKVSFSDIKSSIGITVDLGSIGSSLGVPTIIQNTSTSYDFRTMESGSGILVQVSPQNGTEIGLNLKQDVTGVPIFDDLGAAKPTIASLLPGAGMQINKVGDVITFTATGAALPTTQAVTVNQESDFPDAVSGVITLEPSTAYIISNSFSMTNRLVLSSSTTIVSFGKEGPLLTYTGTGTMFTSVDVSCVIGSLHYDCPNGKAHDHSDTTGNNAVVNLVNSRLRSCVEYGDFTSLGFIVIFNSDCFLNATSGPVFTGTGWKLISVERFALTSTSASYVGVDLGSSTSDVIEYNDLIISGPAGAVGVTGLVNSGNITTGNLATIVSCNFPGDITPITNIDPVSDVRWQSLGNDGIGDSRDDCLVSIQGNSSETVIAIAGTPVKMVGTWTDEGSSRFTVTAAGGRMTYIGERSARLPISATLSVATATGGTKQVSACIAINGTAVVASKIETSASSSQAGTITIFWQHEFNENDYAEVWLSNETDTVNVIGQASVARID